MLSHVKQTSMVSTRGQGLHSNTRRPSVTLKKEGGDFMYLGLCCRARRHVDALQGVTPSVMLLQHRVVVPRVAEHDAGLAEPARVEG